MQQQWAACEGPSTWQLCVCGETGVGAAPLVGPEGCCCVQGRMPELAPVAMAYRHQSGATPSVFTICGLGLDPRPTGIVTVFFVHYSE